MTKYETSSDEDLPCLHPGEQAERHPLYRRHSDLLRRVSEHKNDVADGFTRKYGVHDLVYYESTGDAESAIRREKQLKKWNRAWKLRLIEEANPEWRDLYEELL